MLYAVLKDFAGPLATLIAAITAIVVTALFNRSQLRVAQSQRDIAHDRLKYDLFKNRYEIYQTGKALIEYVTLVSGPLQSDTTKIRNFYIRLDEARFYFPPGIRAVLDEIHDRCEFVFTLLSKRDPDVDDPEEWSRSADALAVQQKALRAIYDNLPKTFEEALAFRQLTTS